MSNDKRAFAELLERACLTRAAFAVNVIAIDGNMDRNRGLIARALAEATEAKGAVLAAFSEREADLVAAIEGLLPHLESTDAAGDPLTAIEEARRVIAIAPARVLTEDEHRAAFVKRFGSCPIVEMYARDWQSEWVGYIACARANGLVKS